MASGANALRVLFFVFEEFTLEKKLAKCISAGCALEPKMSPESKALHVTNIDNHLLYVSNKTEVNSLQ